MEFRLSAIPGGTRVALRHSGLPDTELCGHADGWANFLPRLQAAGGGLDPGPDRWRPLPERTRQPDA